MAQAIGASSRMNVEQIHQMLLGIDRRARLTALAALLSGLILSVGVPSVVWVVVWVAAPHQATPQMHSILVAVVVPLLWIGACIRQGGLAYDQSDHWEPSGTSVHLRRGDDTQTPGMVVMQEITRQLNIGNTDLFYKLDKGYIGYSKGKSEGVFDSTDTRFAFKYTRPMWESVLRPFLNASA